MLGWSWDNPESNGESQWNVDISPEWTDSEGWTYSVDFGSLNDTERGSALKGMMHFVRRRRMYRSKYLDGKNKIIFSKNLTTQLLYLFSVSLICNVDNVTCDYCDSQEIDRLATLFLEKLCSASIAKHPRMISDLKINTLKNALINALELSGPEGDMKAYSFESLSQCLDKYVDDVKSVLSMASSALSSGSQSEQVNKR